MLTVDITGADAFLKRVDALGATGTTWKHDLMDDMGKVAEKKLKDQLYPGHGKITGLLQRSIKHITYDDKVFVGTQGMPLQSDPNKSYNYARIVNDGAPPHMIDARRKKSLSFQWKGELVFFKSVMHPGFRGLHFVEEVMKTIDADLQPLIANRTAAIKKVLAP